MVNMISNNRETFFVKQSKSIISEIGGLVLSNKGSDGETVDLVIGSPGLPNLDKILYLGDAILFETLAEGLLEVRMLSLDYKQVEVLVTRISPRLGLTAGLAAESESNAGFGKDELNEIKLRAEDIVVGLSARGDVTDEQLNLLRRTIEEVVDASNRLGRKDWIMLVAGTFTNMVVGAAFAPEATKALFQLAQKSFGWVFQNALRLLS
jgi:hypothetical protein